MASEAGSRLPVTSACLAAIAIAAALPYAGAQCVPDQLPDVSTYKGSMEQQRRDGEGAQQMEQQNQQMQQRLDETYQYYTPGGAGGATGSAAGSRPPPPLKSKPLLPVDKNPLIGRWQQTAGKRADVGILGQMPGVSQMVNGAFAGGCQSIFGKGMIAFGPATYSWVAPDGHEEVLNQVEYRSDGANVIVIPTDPAPLPLIFGLADRDHAVVAFLGCTMQRVIPGAKPAHAAAQARGAASGAQAGQAILNLNVGETVAGRFSPVPAGTQIWLTNQNPDANLVKAGFTPDPGGQPIEKLFLACKVGHGGTTESCNHGMQAMLTGALGVARTDAAGRAQTGAVAPGRYYVVSFVPYKGHSLLWHMPVDIKPGANSLTLEPENGSISH